jgi:hypothetical protein
MYNNIQWYTTTVQKIIFQSSIYLQIYFLHFSVFQGHLRGNTILEKCSINEEGYNMHKILPNTCHRNKHLYEEFKDKKTVNGDSVKCPSKNTKKNKFYHMKGPIYNGKRYHKSWDLSPGQEWISTVFNLQTQSHICCTHLAQYLPFGTHRPNLYQWGTKGKVKVPLKL